MVNEGEEAPDFELKSHDGETIRLSNYRGRWIVLYFFPKAFTSGCTRETQEFTRLWDEFEKLGVVVLGISTDPASTQRKFAEKYGVKFKLLSDSEKRASQVYGVLRPTGTAERTTFIINPEGKVAKVIRRVKPEEHPAKALEFLRQSM
ncbi:peroxiredoxin [Vulcanisaeta souniana]|uniref:thioredoxin-dependent peroxiredoxin n=1 Tax=Vulcanisaeta souniana JCM 11219 TaxID=1293586 RepID=A0A830E3W4_9CREN|nr:peroxiredoxin [Vulcanisaeta souniana]BDR91044.1 peroxiredoxin [Vulcanisaeta souniana JCM 11219]GGI80403.1 peroxiredoxin [Vulcanisaeta souniana JCM 11219]